MASQDPRELVAAALSHARSANPSDHQYLQTWLWSPEFLSLLDSPEEYRQTGRRLRIARILEALAANPAPSAKNVLVDLTECVEFLTEPVRIDFLIRYSAEVRPAPSALIVFWDTYSQPDDGFSNLTLQAVVKNGSAPALALLERKLADPAHSDGDKQFWMRSYMVPRRNDPLLLQTVERLLARTLPPNLRPDLVEAIFDYKPDEWYSEHSRVAPPSRAEAVAEARETLRRIGSLALNNAGLTPSQQAVVRKALVEIGPGER